VNNNKQLIEEKDHWLLPIVGREVTRCLVAYAFSLEFWEPDYLFTIRIGGEFFFTEKGKKVFLSPELPPVGLGPALSMLHQTVASAIAYKSGRLEVRFMNGSYFSVEPDLNFEAWEITATDGLKLVCLPGLGLAVWYPNE
jgi:hypothetical protein